MRRPTFAFRLLSVLLVTVLMALFIASCNPLSGPEGERSKDLPPAAAKIDDRLVSANTEFALGLYKHLALEDESKNICISPASISLALSMTYNGADGDTKDAMAKTLGLEGMTLDEVNEANKDLMSVLQILDPTARKNPYPSCSVPAVTPTTKARALKRSGSRTATGG